MDVLRSFAPTLQLKTTSRLQRPNRASTRGILEGDLRGPRRFGGPNRCANSREKATTAHSSSESSLAFGQMSAVAQGGTRRESSNYYANSRLYSPASNIGHGAPPEDCGTKVSSYGLPDEVMLYKRPSFDKQKRLFTRRRTG